MILPAELVRDHKIRQLKAAVRAKYERALRAADRDAEALRSVEWKQAWRARRAGGAK